MSEADRLLHEIGYMKEYEDSSVEIWNYEERFCIRFNKICKSVDFRRKDKRQFLGLKYHRISIDMQELQAINMKIKELDMMGYCEYFKVDIDEYEKLEKFFGNEENKIMNNIIEKNVVETKNNFFEYYEE